MKRFEESHGSQGAGVPQVSQELGLELPPILSPFPIRGNASLPPLGLDISRPASTSSQASSHYVQGRPSPRPGLQLPGLSQLTSLTSATTSRRGSPDGASMQGADLMQMRYSSPPQTMSSTAVATVGLGGSLPVCQNCSTSTTPMWRRDENGTVLCNACGLFLKLHGRPRPISLKTDTIKSRNRARIQGEPLGPRKKSGTAQSPNDGQGFSKTTKRAKLSQQTAVAALHRSQSPLAQASSAGNIAPQSVFDSIAMDTNPPFSSASTSLSESLSQTVLQSRSEEGSNPLLQESHLSYDALLKEATRMQTRINELDVINVLFRGRVDELESSQQEARSKETTAREAEHTARAELDAAFARETALKRRIEELERRLRSSGSS